jgi:TDG/mug DNA glycosylase family protein
VTARRDVLPDYLARGLRLIVCGTAAGETSAGIGHYYSDPRNKFWQLLWDSRIISEPLSPLSDREVLRFGVGMTDLAKAAVASSDRGLRGYDVPDFISKIERYQPAWVAFHGKRAAEEVSGHLGFGRKVALGVQPWQVADRPAFVLPSGSGSNQNRAHLEGKASRREWFSELQRLLPDARSQ